MITNHPTWIGTKDGSIDIDIYSIRSPDLEEETKNFIVYNYDKENMIVLGRSYNNLDISSMYFGYEIDKYFIDVNYNLEYDLEVGSYSDDIKINVTNPVT